MGDSVDTSGSHTRKYSRKPESGCHLVWAFLCVIHNIILLVSDFTVFSELLIGIVVSKQALLDAQGDGNIMTLPSLGIATREHAIR